MNLKKLQYKHNKTMKKRKKAADKSDWSSASLPKGTFSYPSGTYGVVKLTHGKPQFKENKLRTRAGIKIFKRTTPLKLGRET